MPLVTFTLLKGQPAALKTKLGQAVHFALENAGVPKADRFQRFLELESENFNYDLHYPDLSESRTTRFVLIEILFSVGRSVKVKQKILSDLLEHLQAAGISSNDIMVSFQETAWENWSFANGHILHK
ncbi:MAG: tautomerase family protein [Bacteroidetes bacterium]|nr:tautomerase family protein [Bacteroidota bacterium]